MIGISEKEVSKYFCIILTIPVKMDYCKVFKLRPVPGSLEVSPGEGSTHSSSSHIQSLDIVPITNAS